MKAINPHEHHTDEPRGAALHRLRYSLWERSGELTHCISSTLRLQMERGCSDQTRAWTGRGRYFPSRLHRTKECEFGSRGQVLRVSVRSQRPDTPGGQMPVGVMVSKAKQSDRAPPIGVSLLSCSRALGYEETECLRVGPWGTVSGSGRHLDLAAAQVDRQFWPDSVCELGAALGAVADSSRVTDTTQEKLNTTPDSLTW